MRRKIQHHDIGQFQDPGKDLFSLLFIVFFLITVVMITFYHTLSQQLANLKSQQKQQQQKAKTNPPKVPENKIIYVFKEGNIFYVKINNKKYTLSKNMDFLKKGIFYDKITKTKKAYICFSDNQLNDIPLILYKKITNYFSNKKIPIEAYTCEFK